ncbi:MAG TPA: diaminopimelate epimerase [Vicinamibacterales bacterium]|nr:diaminopimelate epimerase [Vicinamibacterales bacterium]
MRQTRLIKAHAYGNDFLIAPEPLAPGNDEAAFARAVCHRHHGVGADGLMFVQRRGAAARMRLFNADGSRSEVSGNGVRCVAAWIALDEGVSPGAEIVVETDAGPKVSVLTAVADSRLTFRASMGEPTEIRQVELTADGEPVNAVVLRVGNPQCVVIGAVTEERLRRLGGALAVHSYFPEGTNVEFAEVEAPDRVRILIWERGVGPTSSSGTGTCAAAVAAIRYGGANRHLSVSAPGGTQQVEWTEAGLFLTGWAEVIADIDWPHAVRS